jgi:hypothetical protein
MSSPARQLAERYLTNVKPAGGDNLRASCPFHTSSSSRRSLYVFAKTGGWTCWGCGRGGSMPALLYQLGMSRAQVDAALEGVNFSSWVPDSPLAQVKWKTKQGWDTLPEWILGAYDWLPNRMVWWGFTQETLQDFDIGYDEPHARITFPVRDYLGRLAAISGRAEPGGFPRYKVYDASPPRHEKGAAGEFYGVLEGKYSPDNRLHLYGFHRFYGKRFLAAEPDKLPPFILVEGYKGCLWTVQSGFDHAAGLQGSSMTPMQEYVAGTVRGPYYTMLDHEPGKSFPDQRGRCSAFRIADRMARYDRSYVCQYPPGTKIGTSPDDLTSDELRWMIDNAKTTAQARLDLNAPNEGWRRTVPPNRRENP